MWRCEEVILRIEEVIHIHFSDTVCRHMFSNTFQLWRELLDVRNGWVWGVDGWVAGWTGDAGRISQDIIMLVEGGEINLI